MKPFRDTIDATKKYVVSNTLDHVDWNAELVCGNIATKRRRRHKISEPVFSDGESPLRSVISI